MRIIVAVKDSATEAFGMPLYFHTAHEALRSFTEEANKDPETSTIARHPGDYEMYIIGKYDEQHGKIEAQEPPERIGRAKDLVRPQE